MDSYDDAINYANGVGGYKGEDVVGKPHNIRILGVATIAAFTFIIVILWAISL